MEVKGLYRFSPSSNLKNMQRFVTVSLAMLLGGFLSMGGWELRPGLCCGADRMVHAKATSTSADGGVCEVGAGADELPSHQVIMLVSGAHACCPSVTTPVSSVFLRARLAPLLQKTISGWGMHACVAFGGGRQPAEIAPVGQPARCNTTLHSLRTVMLLI